VAVRGRIPDGIIGAVDDAGEPAAALAEDALQAVAEIGGLDFLGVARTDGGDPVGEDDAGLEEVELPVELELAKVEQLPVEAAQRKLRRAKQALIGNVMNREHRTHLLEARPQALWSVAAIDFIQVDR